MKSDQRAESRYKTADKFFESSALNGNKVEDSSGWEHDSGHPDELVRTIFCEVEGQESTVGRKLVVRFHPGSSEIDEAMIDGEPVADVAQLPPTHMWDRDDVQFPRLLAEIKAVGLTGKQMDELRDSMDLDSNQIHELLDRAEETFEAVKMQLGFVDEHCIACNHSFKEDGEDRETLQLARSVIRDMSRGWLENDLVVSPRELVDRITKQLGDNYDFERGE